MTEFFEVRMDYISFFYGLAFLMLAAACLVLVRKKDALLPWSWLGVFGVTHGLREWIDVVKLGLGDSQLLEGVSVIFAVSSFVALFEFARVGLRGLKGKGPGWWIYPPLFVLGALGGLDGWHGLQAASRYAFGLPGCIGSAYVLFLAAKKSGESSVRWLLAGSGAMACYAVAVAVGVPSAHFFPASFINSDVFFRAAGVPVQLVRGVLAIIAAISIWTYSQTLHAEEPGSAGAARYQIVVPVIALLFIMGLGWVLTEFAGGQALEEGRREADRFSGVVSRNYEGEMDEAEAVIRERAAAPALSRALLTGSKEDLKSADSILNQCQYGKEACREIGFLLDRKGKVVLRCPRMPEVPSSTSYLSSPIFKRAFEGRVTRYFAAEPGSLKRNLFVSAPVRDSGGEIVGVAVLVRDVGELEEAFKEHPYCFLVDANGIAFLSSRNDLQLRSLWPLSGNALKDIAVSGQFGPGPFAPVFSRPAADGKYVSLDGKKFLVTRQFTGGDGWSIVLLNSITHIRAYRMFAIFTSFVLFGMTFVFFGVIYMSRESAAQVAASERRYKSLVEGAPSCVMLFDHEGKCLTINRAGLSLLGCPEEDIIGQKLGRYCIEDSRRVVEDAVVQVFKGERRSLEIQGVRPGAKRVVWSAVFNPVFDLDGAVRNFVAILSDVTERKSAEEKLLASEKRFRSYFEQSLIGMAIISPRKEWIDFNDALCHILGYSREGLRQTTWTAVTYAGDIAADVKQFNLVLEGKSDAYSMEKRFARRDGKIIFTNISARCVRKADGPADYFVVLVEDITDRKAAEHALQNALDEMEQKVRDRTAELSEINRRLVEEMDDRWRVTAALLDSEERFHSLFNLASDCILLMDPRKEGGPVIVDANIAACSMHGYTREEVIGKPVRFLDDRESAERTQDFAQRIMEGEALTFEIRHARKDGSTFPVEVSAQQIQIAGRPYILAIDRDITERKRAEEKLQKSEERYRRLVSLSPDGIGVQSEGTILFLNTSGALILGGGDPRTFVGKSVLDFVHPDFREVVTTAEARILAALDKGEMPAPVEVKFLRLDGSTFDAEVAETLISYKEKQSVQFIFRDVTERKKAEEKLREALARLADEKAKSEAIVGALADGLSIQGTDFKVLYQNEVHKALVGDHTGKYCYREYAGGDKICDGCPVALAFSDGNVHAQEKEVSLGVEKKYIEINASPLRDSTGRIIAGIELVRDISERRRVEEIIRASEERYKNLVELSSDIIYITDRGGNQVFMNDAVYRVLGYVPEEVIGQPWTKLIYPGDREQSSERVLDTIAEGVEVFNFENRMVDKKGNVLNMLHNIRILRNDAGETTGTQGIARDITALKRTEEELARHREHLIEMVEERTAELRTAVQLLTQEISYRKNAEATLRESEAEFRKLSQEFNTLLNAIPDTLLLLSPERKVMWANKAAVTSFGLDVPDMIGEYCYNLWHDSPISCEECHVMKSFHTGVEESSKRTSLNGRMFDSRAFPIKDETGEVTSVIVIVSDITEKASLQAEAMRASHLASIGELAAGVAHEINNPINGIINYGQILANRMERGSRENDIARRIMKEGDRIAAIVRSLLSFARERKEEQTNVNLQPVLFEAITLTEAQIRKDGISLEVDMPASLPLIRANSQQIQQVFLNVISNARYALNQRYGGAHQEKVLTIKGEKVMVDGYQHVRIIFYDHGTGIPADFMDKVMNPFFSTKPSGQGTGLGLSISHGIIKNHGGRLMLDSVEGQYTKVIIDLPSEDGNGR